LKQRLFNQRPRKKEQSILIHSLGALYCL